MLTLHVLTAPLAVCRLSPAVDVPAFIWNQPFFCVTRTEDELSIVLPQNLVPSDWQAETDWRAFKVQGPLDFSLTGILSSMAAPLAQANISIFAMSTFDTDYLLVKSNSFEAACQVLEQSGFNIENKA